MSPRLAVLAEGFRSTNHEENFINEKQRSIHRQAQHQFGAPGLCSGNYGYRMAAVPAHAKGGKSCGAYSVTIGNQVFTGKQTILVPAEM